MNRIIGLQSIFSSFFLIFFPTISYESFWNFIGVRFTAVIELFLSFFIAAALIFVAGKINKRIRKENFFVIFIFFVSYMFFLVVTLINDVTRLDLLSFILVSQLLFFLLISCTLQVSFPSGKYFLTYESTKIKIIFFLLSAFFVFFVIYLNQHLGGAHSLINQISVEKLLTGVEHLYFCLKVVQYFCE